jgi:hypothetical protein
MEMVVIVMVMVTEVVIMEIYAKKNKKSVTFIKENSKKEIANSKQVKYIVHLPSMLFLKSIS